MEGGGWAGRERERGKGFKNFKTFKGKYKKQQCFCLLQWSLATDKILHTCTNHLTMVDTTEFRMEFLQFEIILQVSKH